MRAATSIPALLRSVVAGLTFLTLLTAGAIAQAPKPVWFIDEGDVGVFAKWGIPETDAVGMVLSCEAGRIAILPALYAMQEPASVPDVAFTVDGNTMRRSAELIFSERDAAYQAKISVATSDNLIDALRRGSSLTYDFAPPLVEGSSFTLSLSGSAKAIDRVLRGC